MGKRIIIGSMLVLTLLLLMPSIPAVQQKSIEEGVKQNIQDKIDAITLDDLKNIDVVDWIRHPILYLIVISIVTFRLLRSAFYFYIAVDYCTESRPDSWVPEITHPILLIILMFNFARLYGYTWLLVDFWQYISDRLRWNWKLPYPFPN